MLISAVVVVVPVRNEGQRLTRCLAALDAARAHLRAESGTIETRTMVVLDRCTDDSALIATTWPGVNALISGHGRVGAARDLGARRGLAGFCPDSTWIANTDADSAVPPDWLITQIRYARAGADVLLGTVRPDPGELSPAAMREWYARHNLDDGHPHIHGANLGV